MDPKLVVCTIILFLLQTSSAQECDLPTFGIIKEQLQESIQEVITAILKYDLVITVTLKKYSIICLTVSQMSQLSDMYTTSSTLVRFSFSGASTNGTLSNFNGCEAETECYAILEIECDDGPNVWVISNRHFPAQSIRILTNKTELNSKPRLDCVNGYCSPGVTYPDIICTCNTGFTGTLCDTPIGPCDGVLCSNNGDCLALNSTHYMCDCDLGYTGTNCETEIDKCASLPCQNLGTCVQEMFPEFRCECHENFSGKLCETCDLPNCKTCSKTVTGVCEECFNGYLLTDGMCGTCILYNINHCFCLIVVHLSLRY